MLCRHKVEIDDIYKVLFYLHLNNLVYGSQLVDIVLNWIFREKSAKEEMKNTS